MTAEYLILEPRLIVTVVAANVVRITASGFYNEGRGGSIELSFEQAERVAAALRWKRAPA